MASDNLMAMEQLPWTFRPSISDAWISDFLTRDTETLTKALQQSFATTSSDGDGLSAEMVDSLFAKPEMTPVQTPAASGGSEQEASVSVFVSKQRRSLQPNGKVTKRKSRASKRATTTFITADPANFRQMVQQVTGARFGGLDGQLPSAPVLKPEPKRAVSLLQQSTDLPTLDTSSYFLDGAIAVAAASSMLPQPLPSAVAPDMGPTTTPLDFDSFCSFPTLESWKVM